MWKKNQPQPAKIPIKSASSESIFGALIRETSSAESLVAFDRLQTTPIIEKNRTSIGSTSTINSRIRKATASLKSYSAEIIGYENPVPPIFIVGDTRNHLSEHANEPSRSQNMAGLQSQFSSKNTLCREQKLSKAGKFEPISNLNTSLSGSQDAFLGIPALMTPTSSNPSLNLSTPALSVITESRSPNCNSEKRISDIDTRQFLRHSTIGTDHHIARVRPANEDKLDEFLKSIQSESFLVSSPLISVPLKVTDECKKLTLEILIPQNSDILEAVDQSPTDTEYSGVSYALPSRGTVNSYASVSEWGGSETSSENNHPKNFEVLSAEQRLKILINAAKKNARMADYNQALESIRFVLEHLHTVSEAGQTKLGENALKVLRYISVRDPLCARFLAAVYANGINGTHLKMFLPNPALALEFLLSGARKKDVDCIYQASILLSKFSSSTVKESRYYLKKAAKLGHPDAMCTLGLARIRRDFGFTQDLSEGLKWIRRAAREVKPGMTRGLYELAILHENGMYPVLFQDHRFMLALLQDACILHNADAHYKIACGYENGSWGLIHSFPDAYQHLIRAARCNHVEVVSYLTPGYVQMRHL